jgi:hypothetical protein
MEAKNINNEWCNLNLKNSLLNINVFTVSSVTVTVRVTVTQLQLWAHSPFAASSHLLARCYVELHVYLPAAGRAVMAGVRDAVLSLKVRCFCGGIPTGSVVYVLFQIFYRTV